LYLFFINYFQILFSWNFTKSLSCFHQDNWYLFKKDLYCHELKSYSSSNITYKSWNNQNMRFLRPLVSKWGTVWNFKVVLTYWHCSTKLNWIKIFLWSFVLLNKHIKITFTGSTNRIEAFRVHTCIPGRLNLRAPMCWSLSLSGT
jgi:hypothetical protein